jgi:hypothetical protein
LILQSQNNLSDERTEFYLRDRLTWMRFLGLGLGDPVSDANTIWTFREALTRASATLRLFELFDRELRAAGARWRDLAPAPNVSRSVHPGAWSHRAGYAIPQTGDLVLDFEFFTLEAAEQQLIRQGTVHLGVDLLLEEGMLVTKALEVVLHGHPLPSSGWSP